MGRRPKKGSNFIVQGGILAVAGIITRLIGMFYRIPVTNIIGPEGNGYYAAAYQVYNIMLLISSYSLPLAVSKLVSARISNGQYRNANRVFKGALIFAFLTGGAVCFFILIGAEFFAGTLMSEPMSAIALRVFAPTLLIVAVMGVVRGYFQGMGTMIPTAVSQVLEQIANAVVSIVAANYLFSYGKKVAAILRNQSYAPAFGAAGSTIGTSSGAFIGLVFLLIVLIMFSSTLRRQNRRDTSKVKEGYGEVFHIIIMTIVPVILSTAIYNICDIIDNGMFNRIMTMNGKGVEKTSVWGVFTGEYKLLLNVPIALSNAMSASTVPTLASCISSGDKKSARKKISAAMRFTMVIAFPCAVGLGVLALPIMSMLFRDGYELAAGLMHIGCINILFFSMSTLTNGILQGINRMKIPVRNALISLVVHVAVLYVLLTKTDLEIYAVVIANFVFALLMSILNQMAIHKYLRYRQEIARTFIVPALSSGIMGLFIFGIYKLCALGLPNIVSTLISIICGMMIYFVLIIRLRGVRKEELYTMPMGRTIARVAEKLSLL